MTSTTIKHGEYSNVPAFASHMQAAFAGAAVLPNAEVMAACLRQCGNRQRDAKVELIHDGELRSAYRIGGEFGELVVIEAETGNFRTFDLGASDEGSEAAVAEIMAELEACPSR